MKLIIIYFIGSTSKDEVRKKNNGSEDEGNSEEVDSNIISNKNNLPQASSAAPQELPTINPKPIRLDVDYFQHLQNA